MVTAELRAELHKYIDQADDNVLKIVMEVFETYPDDYTLPGKPMSEEQLKERVKSAKARIEAGQFTTQEELEEEMRNW